MSHFLLPCTWFYDFENEQIDGCLCTKPESLSRIGTNGHRQTFLVLGKKPEECQPQSSATRLVYAVDPGSEWLRLFVLDAGSHSKSTPDTSYVPRIKSNWQTNKSLNTVM